MNERILVIGLPELPSALRAAGQKVIAVDAPDEAEGVAFGLVILDGRRPESLGFAVAHRTRGRPEALLVVGGDRAMQRLADGFFADGVEPGAVVEAAAHRVGIRAPRWFRVGGRVVDVAGRRVFGPGGAELLTEQEALLIAALAPMGEAGLSREDLLRRVFGSRVASRAVDHAVARLRPKIEDDPEQPAALLTLRGQGYALLGEVLAGPPATLGVDVPMPGPSPLLAADGLLADLRRAWDDGAPLVALHGPPGCGKSSIARTFARSLGVPVVALDFSTGAVPAVPGGVVLLDDTDPAAAPLARALAPRLGVDVRAIWTGRARPELSMARCFLVPPWHIDDARRLAAARGHTDVDALLAAVLAATGGNPLAIELALSRLLLLTPDEIIRRLGEPGLLGDPVRRPARHRRFDLEADGWTPDGETAGSERAMDGTGPRTRANVVTARTVGRVHW